MLPVAVGDLNAPSIDSTRGRVTRNVVAFMKYFMHMPVHYAYSIRGKKTLVYNMLAF